MADAAPSLSVWDAWYTGAVPDIASRNNSSALLMPFATLV